MSAKPRLLLVSAVALLLVGSSSRGNEHETIDSITINPRAVESARMLIDQRRVVMDGRGSWQQDQLSAEAENDFIRRYGFDEYAKWHLGIDRTHAQDTKARYKFPYGDFENVHRCALLAAKYRARQYHHLDVENAAAQLLNLLSLKKEISGEATAK